MLQTSRFVIDSPPMYRDDMEILYKAQCKDFVYCAKIFKTQFSGIGISPSDNIIAYDMFTTESDATDILHHPNIIQTIAKGLQDGWPFLIYDFFAGGTLRSYLDLQRTLNWE